MPVCKTCGEGTTTQGYVYRWGRVVAAVGYALLVLAALGVPLAIYLFVDTQTGAPSSGDVNVAGLGAGCAGILVLGSLVGGLLGFFLIRKKAILKCDDCGDVVES